MAALFRDTAWYIAQDPHYTLWRYNIRKHTGANRKITASNYLLSCGVSHIMKEIELMILSETCEPGRWWKERRSKLLYDKQILKIVDREIQKKVNQGKSKSERGICTKSVKFI